MEWRILCRMYADQDVLFTEDAEADDDDEEVGEDVRVESEPQPQDETHELPYLPSSPVVDFRHTSVPPPRFCSPIPTLPVPTPRRAPKPKPSPIPRAALVGPDQDADYESDNDTPSDDEYHPSPPLNPKKRFSTSRTSTRAAKKQRLSPSPAPFRASPNKRPRAPPPSRNKQASAVIDLSAHDANDYKCPVCDWVQENHRKPDFLRHLNTHTRAPETDQTKGWWCKGVRLEDLDEYNRGAREDGRKTISRDMEPKQFRDHVRIGGCLQNFSRRDALKRHLDNPAMACAGFACKAMDER
ncbi:hypothetical protein BDZ89DRAFT_654495 [Hymenopellis radicata]|nr:hypothetical protein BDZ89DRAFT_654495 [Hymenopellis radicata]